MLICRKTREGLTIIQKSYETAEAKAEHIVAEELRRLDWRETDLASQRKSDPAKLPIAARLRKETALSIKQIAGRLRLVRSRSASVRLHTGLSQTAPTERAQGCLGI